MTENVSDRFIDIDQWSSLDSVEAMYEGQLLAIAAIKPSLPAIATASDDAARRLANKGRMVYVGAGTSGRLAVLDGTELGPTFNWPQEQIIPLIAGGLDAMTISSEGAEDDYEEGKRLTHEANLNSNDVMFAVAASGRTPFTLGAMEQAKSMGALTIGIANNPGTPILDQADHGLLAETGSEIIAGSTRMKAGTAQKAILNMLSTAIMIRLGRVYKGYMIDMLVSNDKLHNRAVNMICEITGASEDVAKDALDQADQHIKTATLISMGQSLQDSKNMLQETNGNLREALRMVELRGKS